MRITNEWNLEINHQLIRNREYPISIFFVWLTQMFSEYYTRENNGIPCIQQSDYIIIRTNKKENLVCNNWISFSYVRNVEMRNSGDCGY